MGKDNNNGLLGVALGALIVGTTLALRDFLEDPKNREAVRRTVSAGYTKVKNGVQQGYTTARSRVEAGVATARTKVSEGVATAKAKVSEGVATVREKAEETGRDIRAAVESAPAVKKIRKTVEDIRRAAADPVEQYFREDEETPAEETPALDTPAEETLPEGAPADEATAVWDTPDE